MRGYNPAAVLVALIALAALAAQSGATYWFQSGARGSTNAYYNTGASVQIQTIAPQNVSSGSFGYWIGETISNGAFIQAGYVVPNESGYYPTNCTVGSGANATCSKGIYLSKGEPAWFWEYFPSTGNRSAFYGSYGPTGSAGSNGTFNTYSFKANGNVWDVYFDQQLIGSVDLGAPGSGANAPEAIAEYADTETNSTLMKTVQFKDAAYYSSTGQLRLMPTGYAYVSYGRGSETSLKNLYGVAEVGQYVDYFEVGSAVSVPPDSAQLWSLGYELRVSSSVGNTSSTANYSAYSNVKISMPAVVNVLPGVRETFEGWKGSGLGSYTGNMTSAVISMYGNITETAVWQEQYGLNVSSQYPGVLDVPGGVWYDAGSVARFYVNQSLLPISYGERAVFEGWSTKSNSTLGEVTMHGPTNVTAYWTTQYLVNATSVYGNTIGSGWYGYNSLVAISVDTVTVPISQYSRMEFSGWSNGNQSTLFNTKVTAPILVHTTYQEQYLVNFTATDSYGNRISPDYFVLSNQIVDGSAFIYANRQYELQYAVFKGARIGINSTVRAYAPESINSQLPVYNVTISAESWLGQPVNASINVTFANGTRRISYLGPTGETKFADVPYGTVSGSINYFFVTEKVGLIGGENEKLNFITPGAIGAIVLTIIAIALTVRALLKIEREHNKWRARKT